MSLWKGWPDPLIIVLQVQPGMFKTTNLIFKAVYSYRMSPLVKDL